MTDIAEVVENLESLGNASNTNGVSVSSKIKQRLEDAGVAFSSNDNISDWIQPHEHALLKQELEQKMESVFDTLLIDYKNDHNTKNTARRMSDMFFDEFFKGRYQPMPSVTEFPNAKNLDEIYTLGPINLQSMCSHHFLPITGQVWLGILPSDRIIGISKFNRIIDWVMSRPQIQEEAAVMITDTIEQLIEPKGLAVIIKAAHSCMNLRGVKDHQTSMTNAIMRGEFLEDATKKSEFYDLIKSQGF